MSLRNSNNRKKIIAPSNRGITFARSLVMKKKILVADDDPAIRDIFKMIFEKAGYSIELKENGKDVLENNYELPHVFLIDKQLSGVDGLNICRHLKNNKATKHIPVIMVSASPDIGPLSQKAGADGYIEKPFDLKCLLNLVEKHAHARSDGSKSFDKC